VAQLQKIMKRIHLIVGLLVIVAFVITGQFMMRDFPEKDVMSQELRVFMRSRHIYILFSGLIHLVLGVYLQIRPQLWRRALQYAGSAILVACSVLLVKAFFSETYASQHASAVSFSAVIGSLIGVGFHLIGGFGESQRPS